MPQPPICMFTHLCPVFGVSWFPPANHTQCRLCAGLTTCPPSSEYMCPVLASPSLHSHCGRQVLSYRTGAPRRQFHRCGWSCAPVGYCCPSHGLLSQPSRHAGESHCVFTHVTQKETEYRIYCSMIEKYSLLVDKDEKQVFLLLLL